MVELANRNPSAPAYPPFQEYVCFWAAFNNIYVTLADNRGPRATLKRENNGTVKTERKDNYTFAKVRLLITEEEQIREACTHFDAGLEDTLIRHPNAAFFVTRVPRWHGCEVRRDAFRQDLNGVISVGRTIDPDYPIWSPIDGTLYNQYISGAGGGTARRTLARQIVAVLYTVRNNIVHGGERSDDANDRSVVQHAFPLLRLIVLSLLDRTDLAE